MTATLQIGNDEECRQTCFMDEKAVLHDLTMPSIFRKGCVEQCANKRSSHQNALHVPSFLMPE
jgi:hypothetical protein